MSVDESTTLLMDNDDVPPRKDKKYMSQKFQWTIGRVIAFVISAFIFQMLFALIVSNWDKESTTQTSAIEKSTKSKYKNVQGMGFQIYTGAAPAFLTSTDSENKIPNPECEVHYAYGQLVGEEGPLLQCYIGHEDPFSDISRRIQIMREAVDKAYVYSDKDPETLKVFLAPEFYFRGVSGAYIFDDEEPNDPAYCGPICALLKGLEDIVAEKRFEDWLFLFGTVVASDKVSDSESEHLFYNFAPIYKGYDPARMDHQGKRFLSPKRYVSSSDFLTPARYLNSTVTKQLVGQQLPRHDNTVFNPHDFNRKRYDSDVWLNYRDELNGLGYALLEYGWLMVDGLALSVEICFDHQMHTALNTYLGDIVTGRHTLIPSSSDHGLEYVQIPQYQAQLSIVSSAGMTVVPESLVLTNNGTIFLQDGLSNGTNSMFWGTEGCELGLQFDGGTEAVQRKAFLSATDVFFEHTALSSFRRLWVQQDWEKSLNGSFSTKVYKPEIVLFDPLPIALVY